MKGGSKVNCQKSIVGGALALPLFMLRGFADHPHDAAAPYDAAHLADAADRGADFHAGEEAGLGVGVGRGGVVAVVPSTPSPGSAAPGWKR